ERDADLAPVWRTPDIKLDAHGRGSPVVDMASGPAALPQCLMAASPPRGYDDPDWQRERGTADPPAMRGASCLPNASNVDWRPFSRRMSRDRRRRGRHAGAA